MMLPDPDHDSIFGNTYDGVPNPMVPHLHPYPTRYHGPVWREPEAIFSYRDRPRDVPLQSSVVRRSLANVVPDGLGTTPVLLASPTGSSVLDLLIGAGVGYLVAPKQDRLLLAGIGAAATLVSGTLGLAAAVVAGLHMRKKQ